METAKVDIRKLQQLNDRINQCLDALNQVRLSVHGLSHTSGINPMGQLGQVGLGQFAGIGGAQDPRFSTPGINPLAQPVGIGAAGYGQAGFGQAFGAGLSHTGSFASPLAQQLSAFPQAWNPMLQQQAAVAPFVPFAGLSHTGFEAIEGYAKPSWTDPVLQVKVAQTFPYAQYAVPPVVSLY